MGYIDSHAHLTTNKLFDNRETIIADFSSNNIERVMLICCDEDDYSRAYRLVKDYPYFDIAKGIHPESASEYLPSQLLHLRAQLADGLIAMLGEIGLDYYWTKDNKAQQQELFIKQLALADEFALPISVHCRDASEATYEILKKYHQSKRGVMHCYSGSKEMMLRFLDLGYYISLAGPVTFKNARVTREVAVALPIERLLYESDCPYLTPEPFRGKVNNPNRIIYTAKKIAELKGIEVEELNEVVVKNYFTLLGG